MSASSVAASSLASPPAAPQVSESKSVERKPADESTVRPAPPREPEQEPVKAALPLKVGQVIDISA